MGLDTLGSSPGPRACGAGDNTTPCTHLLHCEICNQCHGFHLECMGPFTLAIGVLATFIAGATRGTTCTKCSLWGLSPRPMAHKTIALTTELRELMPPIQRWADKKHSPVIVSSLAANRPSTKTLCLRMLAARKCCKKRAKTLANACLFIKSWRTAAPQAHRDEHPTQATEQQQKTTTPLKSAWRARFARTSSQNTRNNRVFVSKCVAPRRRRPTVAKGRCFLNFLL